MAANITATSANSSGGVEGIRSARRMELVKLQGASTAAADTSNGYVSSLSRPAIVIGGGFAMSVSGQTCTFTALFALGSNANYVWIAEAL